MTIKAIDPLGAEQMALDPKTFAFHTTSGAFRIERDCDTSAPLTVYYHIENTPQDQSPHSATNGADYQPIPTSQVTIPAGSRDTGIVIDVIDDGIVEGPEFVRITLDAPIDQSYVLSTEPDQQSAEVDILDNDTLGPGPGPGGDGASGELLGGNDLIDVAIMPVDLWSSEFQTSTGSWQVVRHWDDISRTDPLPAAVIDLQVTDPAGTATYGVDYQPLHLDPANPSMELSVPFADGQDSLTFQCQPIDDNVYDPGSGPDPSLPHETAIVNINVPALPPNYVLVAPGGSATVGITDNDEGMIGDYVWMDTDGNGIQDSSEPGVSGVTVNLLADGVVVQTTTTDGSGHYQFTNFDPCATYQVQVVLPTGDAATIRYATTPDLDSNIDTQGFTETFSFSSDPIDDTIDAGLVPSAGVQLEESIFQGGYDMMDEETDAMLTDHWLDTNHNGVIDQPEEHSYPYAYVRNSTLSLREVDLVATDDPPPNGPLEFRATVYGEGQPLTTILPVTASLVNGEYVLTDVSAAGPFINEVYSYKPLIISWQMSADSGGAWQDAGRSSNRLYLTFAPQDKDDIPYETLYAFGSDGGKGAQTAQATFDGIWSNFSGLKPKSAQTGKPFYYYKDWLLPSVRLRDNTNAALGFIKTQDGNCGAWTEFLVWCMFKQGLFKDPQFQPAGAVVIYNVPSANPYNKIAYNDPKNSPFEGVLVKDWDFVADQSARKDDPIYIYTNFVGQPFTAGQIPGGTPLSQLLPQIVLNQWPRMKKVGGSWQYDWENIPNVTVNVTDKPGIPGQNTDNPLSVLPDHAVVGIKVMVGGQLQVKLYDPSYGKVYNDLMDLQNQLVTGFYYVADVAPDPTNPTAKKRAMLIRKPTVKNGQVQLELRLVQQWDVGPTRDRIRPDTDLVEQYPFM